MYCALIVPYITYCVEVWGHTYKTNLNSIYRLQKKAVRIVKRVDYYEPTNHLFFNLHAFRAVTVAVTTASPAVVGCHRGCVRDVTHSITSIIQSFVNKCNNSNSKTNCFI